MRTTIERTGSRRFGSATAASDFDFYAQYTPEFQGELMARGFRAIPLSGRIPNLKAVMRKGKIDVQLFEDVERKRLEHRIASFTPIALLLRYSPKKVRRGIWQILQRV